MRISVRRSLEVLGVLALVAGLLSVFPVVAQPGQGDERSVDPEQRLQRLMERLTSALSLTNEQRDQVELVLRDSGKQLMALRDGRGEGNVDQNAMRQETQKLQKETDSKLAAILDDEQMARYRELAEQRRKQIRENRGAGGQRPSQGN